MVDTRVNLCGVELRNPVVPASGTFGFGLEVSGLYDLNVLGGISIKGTTPMVREGNAQPRIAETPNGMLNSVGLQNPGAEHVAAVEIPALRRIFAGAVIANVSGFSEEDYRSCARTIGPLCDLLEVNISCPNVHGGGMAFGTDPKAAASITRAVKEECGKPVFVKLSPNVTDIVAIARACEDAGADGLTLINTVSAMRINLATRGPVLAAGTGGLSGPAILPLAVRMVWQVANACSLPIMGCGGVSGAEDVVEMMMAGATAVQVGAANLVNPFACKEIVENLPAVMQKYQIDSLKDIIGCVKKM